MGQIKIEIKVDDNTTYTFLEEDNMIEGMALTRKMDADISSLCSTVESGEVNLTLSNLYNDFNVLSSSSPYNKLKNGLEVKLYSVSNQNNLLFTGYIVDFTAPTSTNTQSCDIRLVDRLQFILNADISLNEDLQINKSITLFEYISILFSLYGVETDEIEIDEDLREITLDYTILNGKKLAEQLNEICKAVDCYIFVNRVGKIIVKSKEITGTPVKTFSREDDENYLSSSEYGYSLFSSYNSLKIGYVSTKLSDVKNILSIDSLSVQQGLNVIENYELGMSNLYELDNIKITSDSDSEVEEVKATASTITFSINNPTAADDIISISVFGKVIETADAFIVKSVDDEEVNQSIEVKSLLIQSKIYADDLSKKLFARASQQMPYIKAEVEMKDFSVDLGYIVKIIDSEAEFEYIGYIHSIEVEYDGQGFSFYTLGIKMLNEGVNNDE